MRRTGCTCLVCAGAIATLPIAINMNPPCGLGSFCNHAVVELPHIHQDEVPPWNPGRLLTEQNFTVTPTSGMTHR